MAQFTRTMNFLVSALKNALLAEVTVFHPSRTAGAQGDHGAATCG
jgi:hypothetical protein